MDQPNSVTAAGCELAHVAAVCAQLGVEPFAVGWMCFDGVTVGCDTQADVDVLAGFFALDPDSGGPGNYTRRGVGYRAYSTREVTP